MVTWQVKEQMKMTLKPLNVFLRKCNHLMTFHLRNKRINILNQGYNI